MKIDHTSFSDVSLMKRHDLYRISRKGDDTLLNADNVREAVENYGDTLYRVCIVMLKNKADAEDALQETFLSYMLKAPAFNSSDHEKAWLITVASNKCRDILRANKRHRTESEEKLLSLTDENEDDRMIGLLTDLPEKFRIVLTLHYIEGYKVDEIAKMIGRSSSAVKMRLQKGRKLLENAYRKEYLL